MSSRRRTRIRDRGGARIITLRVLGIVVAGFILLAVAGAAVAYGYVNKSLQALPDINDPNAFKVAQPTKIYSADGVLLANFHLENREVVPMSSIATALADAVVATEDERFYQHNGVDALGILRAVVIDLQAGSVKEGASTITQQYIRNTVLANQARDITFARKIREGYLAWEFEKTHSKADILGRYLNAVYFGDGAYGAQAASLQYFGKPATQLTLAEAALLGGLPQSPNGFNPYTNLPAAKSRQRWVLSRMVANKYITQKQADDAAKQPLALTRAANPNQGIFQDGYFVSYVRKLLLAQYPDSLIFKGGLNVYTTIDEGLQAAAVRAVHSTLNRANDPESALVAIDPRTGFIRAMYGGPDYNADPFNTATQGRRQPGSSFKMFVLVTAIEKGIPPSRPIDSSSPAVIPTHPVWKVSNSEGKGSGYITISDATRNSVNCVFARLIWELGASEVATTAKRMGITSNIPPYPSIALGSAPVSPLEMASAFGTLAANGTHFKPTAITKIVNSDGQVILDYKPAGIQVLTPEVAWATTQQLMGVVESGTGTRAALRGREVAGKTGTAQNYQDAWFVGYTPQMVTAVWMGQREGSVPMTNIHGQRAFGGTFCAPIWHNFMNDALGGQAKEAFARFDAPHYTWKSSWDHAIGKAVPPGVPLPVPVVPPVTPPPPNPPPPTPPASGTPTP
jgi:1A family penicillin-binding protein